MFEMRYGYARSEALSSGWKIKCARVVYMRVGYLTLGTYNAVLAWLVKKAEDNQLELPFCFFLSESWSFSFRENEGGKIS